MITLAANEHSDCVSILYDDIPYIHTTHTDIILSYLYLHIILYNNISTVCEDCKTKIYSRIIFSGTDEKNGRS